MPPKVAHSATFGDLLFPTLIGFVGNAMVFVFLAYLLSVVLPGTDLPREYASLIMVFAEVVGSGVICFSAFVICKSTNGAVSASMVALGGTLYFILIFSLGESVWSHGQLGGLGFLTFQTVAGCAIAERIYRGTSKVRSQAR